MTLMMKKMGKKGGGMDMMDMQGMDLSGGLPKGFNPGNIPFRRK